jgi:hypothetical protein
MAKLASCFAFRLKLPARRYVESQGEAAANFAMESEAELLQSRGSVLDSVLLLTEKRDQ